MSRKIVAASFVDRLAQLPTTGSELIIICFQSLRIYEHNQQSEITLVTKLREPQVQELVVIHSENLTPDLLSKMLQISMQKQQFCQLDKKYSLLRRVRSGNPGGRAV